MLLGPRGADLLGTKLKRNETEAQSGKPPATAFLNKVETDQVNFFFRAAIKKHELEQAGMNARRSAIHQLKPEVYMSDIDM